MESKKSLVWSNRNSGQCNVGEWPIVGLMWTVKWKWKESNLFSQSHCVQEVQIKSTPLWENPMNEMASSCTKMYSNGQSPHLATLVLFFLLPFYGELKTICTTTYCSMDLQKRRTKRNNFTTYRYRRRSKCTNVSSEKVELIRLSARWLKQIRRFTHIILTM